MDTCPTKRHLAEEADAPAAKPAIWRSLEELQGEPSIAPALHREFPEGASEWRDPVSRRAFLKASGATLALAGAAATGCTRQPPENIVPYVSPPEVLVPGKPLFFATAMPMGGYGIGLLGESHMGRPTKVEGNPDHPASLGAADAFAQASVLSLWDPDRAQASSRMGQPSGWSQFVSELDRFTASKGKGIRVRLLTETVTSPTLIAQIRALLARFAGSKWHQYQPVGNDAALAGARKAFGRPVNTIYDFTRADRVLSLDADFLACGPGAVRYAREFIDKRRTLQKQPAANGAEVASNRLYVAESAPTITGAMADHRLPIQARHIEALARAVLAELTGKAAQLQVSLGDAAQQWARTVAADLAQHKGRSIVVAGAEQPAAVHALAHAMNAQLGNAGAAVIYTELPEVLADANSTGAASLKDLIGAMDGGEVDLLLVLSDNPCHTAPADIDFRAALERFSNRTAGGQLERMSVHLSPYYNHTSRRAHWHIPESHYLESWGDVRAFDGTASIIQPLISPIYESRSAYEVLSTVLGDRNLSSREVIANQWRAALGSNNFQQAWTTALQRGVVPNTASKRIQVTLQANATAPDAPLSDAPGLEIVFRPDPSIWDGRYFNNGWLQELPKPLTKLTWENAALMSSNTAVKLGLAPGDSVIGYDDLHKANEQVVRLTINEASVEAPVLVVPNHPDDTITVHLGYGQEDQPMAGAQADEMAIGFDAYRLRRSDGMGFAQGLSVVPLNRSSPLGITQKHQVIESKQLDGRDLIHVTTVEEHKKAGETGHKTVHLSMYEPWNYGYNMPDQKPRYEGQHAWGMSVDMNSCIGCNACVVACQAENNIAVVGKEQVITSREMHWIRIDTYWRGDTPQSADGPYFQPMMCQHCETAPCETVCPVGATSHSAEGINEMTYNRCVGTRYCSNNCPYKVRRFNFLRYFEDQPAFQMMRNPDVTVRARGVMEKCTFCVQRVNEARRELKKIEAQATDFAGNEEAQRNVKSRMDQVMRGLKTACEQSCPTQAIVFGDLNWKYADGTPHDVVRLKAQPHDYAVLDELNTLPRTTYLARLKNPNPEMPAFKA